MINRETEEDPFLFSSSSNDWGSADDGDDFHSKSVSETPHNIHSHADCATSNRSAATRKYRGVPLSYFVVVLSVAAQLQLNLPTTTILEVVRQTVCRYYWDDTDLGGHVDDVIPDEVCQQPHVQEAFSSVLTVLAVVIGIGGFLMYGPISYVAGEYGRKPAFLLLLLFNAASYASILLAIQGPQPLQILFLILCVLTRALSGVNHFALLTTMYVVDTTSAEERTSIISIANGFISLADIPAYALGGFITESMQSATTVFSVCLVITCVAILYAAFILPESFDSQKRAALRYERQVENSRSNALSGSETTAFRRVRLMLFTFLHPLKFIRLQCNPETGRYNLRILWCALHKFTSTVAYGHLGTVLLIFLTVHLGYKPDDNGYMLTALSLSAGLSLTVLTPIIMKWIRPVYMHYSASHRTVRALVQQETDDENLGTKDTQFDVAFTVLGWSFTITAVLMLPLVRTYAQTLATIVLFGIGTCQAPAFRSVVVASVEPIRSGEALSAIEMTGSIATAMSPMVLGPIVSATISTFPGVVFIVTACILLVSVIMLLFVEEEDRYVSTPADTRLRVVQVHEG